MWDVDSLDWKGISASEITKRVTGKVTNGSIVLFHNAGEHTPEALPDILDYLLAEGHVGAVPGAAYGLSPFFRISTATSDEVLTEAISRIARAVAALQPAEVTA